MSIIPFRLDAEVLDTTDVATCNIVVKEIQELVLNKYGVKLKTITFRKTQPNHLGDFYLYQYEE